MGSQRSAGVGGSTLEAEEATLNNAQKQPPFCPDEVTHCPCPQTVPSGSQWMMDEESWGSPLPSWLQSQALGAADRLTEGPIQGIRTPEPGPAGPVGLGRPKLIPLGPGSSGSHLPRVHRGEEEVAQKATGERAACCGHMLGQGLPEASALA